MSSSKFMFIVIFYLIIAYSRTHSMFSSEFFIQQSRDVNVTKETLNCFFNSEAYVWFLRQCEGERGKLFINSLSTKTGLMFGESIWRFESEPEKLRFFGLLDKHLEILFDRDVIDIMCKKISENLNILLHDIPDSIDFIFEAINMLYHKRMFQGQAGLSSVELYCLYARSEEFLVFLCRLCKEISLGQEKIELIIQVKK